MGRKVDSGNCEVRTKVEAGEGYEQGAYFRFVFSALNFSLSHSRFPSDFFEIGSVFAIGHRFGDSRKL